MNSFRPTVVLMGGNLVSEQPQVMYLLFPGNAVKLIRRKTDLLLLSLFGRSARACNTAKFNGGGPFISNIILRVAWKLYLLQTVMGVGWGRWAKNCKFKVTHFKFTPK